MIGLNLPGLGVLPQAEAPILSRLSKVSGSIPAGKDTRRISADGKCWISWRYFLRGGVNNDLTSAPANGQQGSFAEATRGETLRLNKLMSCFCLVFTAFKRATHQEIDRMKRISLAFSAATMAVALAACQTSGPIHDSGAVQASRPTDAVQGQWFDTAPMTPRKSWPKAATALPPPASSRSTCVRLPAARSPRSIAPSSIPAS
jgi:hypothetical protein